MKKLAADTATVLGPARPCVFLGFLVVLCFGVTFWFPSVPTSVCTNVRTDGRIRTDSMDGFGRVLDELDGSSQSGWSDLQFHACSRLVQIKVEAHMSCSVLFVFFTFQCSRC